MVREHTGLSGSSMGKWTWETWEMPLSSSQDINFLGIAGGHLLSSARADWRELSLSVSTETVCW